MASKTMSVFQISLTESQVVTLNVLVLTPVTHKSSEEVKVVILLLSLSMPVSQNLLTKTPVILDMLELTMVT